MKRRHADILFYAIDGDQDGIGAQPPLSALVPVPRLSKKKREGAEGCAWRQTALRAARLFMRTCCVCLTVTGPDVVAYVHGLGLTLAP